jgi:CMP-N-acetylneuraminic acid synthetase
MKQENNIESNSGKSIVIIPARGGSKRFPRKNIALLRGKPLLSYSIESAKCAKEIYRVYVSTEDQEIAEIAKSYGAYVPFLRSKQLSGDLVTADEVVKDMLRKLIKIEKFKIDYVILVQPTSPFITADHLNRTIKKFKSNATLDSVTTLTKLDHRNHPFNLSIDHHPDEWKFIFDKERKNSKNRQSKPNAYKFGNLFASTTKTMLKNGRFGEKKGKILIDELYSFDIDYPIDLKIAEFLLENNYVNISS